MICSLNIMDLISSDYESFNILKNKMAKNHCNYLNKTNGNMIEIINYHFIIIIILYYKLLE